MLVLLGIIIPKPFGLWSSFGSEEELRSADVESQNAPAARQMSDEVQLSDETVVELNRAGFDEEKVAQIKQALADGNYPLDPKRIAEGFTEIEKLL